MGVGDMHEDLLHRHSRVKPLDLIPDIVQEIVMDCNQVS